MGTMLADDSPCVSGESLLDQLRALRRETPGHPDVCVAVLDGPVDLSHPCFRGARLTRLDTLVQEPPGGGAMSTHGTHVTSVIFGQRVSGTMGLAGQCRGLLLPVFRDNSGFLSQLDLARAIERAVFEGAQIINVSGGERAHGGEPDPILGRALSLCDERNVLVVAATGNDGCDCVHVPAAVPSVLAVGAMDRAGTPIPSSNFGEAYRRNGVLAPGEAIPGAVPGGGIATASGSSFATPIVSGLAALLMSVQIAETGSPDAKVVRDAILDSAIPCAAPDAPDRARYLAGALNVNGAYALITRGGTANVAEIDSGPAAEDAPFAAHAASWGGSIETGAGVAASAAPPSAQGGDGAERAPSGGDPGPSAAQPAGVAPSCGCGGSGAECSCGATPSADGPAEPVPVPVPVAPVPTVPAAVSLIYAIGSVGFDFGTEARRDTFRQLMPEPMIGSPPIHSAANPYDTTQLADYLDSRPSESTKLIWTLNLELTPIYAIEAESSYPEEVYRPLRQALRNQSLPPAEPDFVSRVSIPGVLTTRTVQLFSGQVVPVVVAQPRGLYTWNEAALVDAVVDAISTGDVDAGRVRRKVRQMLDKVYYQMRNLGQSPPDRAINFQATNAFVFASQVADGLLSGRIEREDSDLYSLDTITAIKSPYCRVDSDCWDVQLSFFDPDNDQRARVIFQSTIDVSDQLPVQLAPTHQFLFR